ncbi:hypothetical protein P4493_05350 [Bacillus thuringiensis]|uniref:Uncharacterized protein n=3 Tax=Bacillus thuringiensis TaxID=1428 RepID=A0A0B5NL33_BACTU|nr:MULTISPECIES: hypothetical protein [Bacillus]MEC2536180.1 hypothetical protein [Bacillus cereus]MED1153578.1 hypothetical protein [Bacillus paranthracis]OUB09133.1 hypothetical protein BK708_31835 [Bacillus thuringiensis serovar yunnanensis]AFQ29906.1 hypothetical protein BTF1_29027 [Bacillus thuringiensis HD-789]AJG74087.1 hypothetical protein BF38_5693 [Bacillus thuringiensis]
MKLEKIERKLNALYMDLKYAQLFTSEDSVTDEVNTVMENIKGILTEPKEKLMVSALKEIAQQLDLVLKEVSYGQNVVNLSEAKDSLQEIITNLEKLN